MNYYDLESFLKLLVLFRYLHLEESDWIIPEVDHVISVVKKFMEDFDL